MTFLLRPQIILLAGAIATPTYIAYEVHRLTRLYPRRKPEHFSPVLIPPHPCTQHVPRSNAVVFSARLHGDVLYSARRRYIRKHADVFWTDEESDSSSSSSGVSQTNNADGDWSNITGRRGGGNGKRNNGVRSAFDDGEDAVSLNELWARTFMSCKTISREAWWYGKLFNRRRKTTPTDHMPDTSPTTKSFTAEGSINISFSTTASPPLQMSSSSSSTITTPSMETPNLSNPTVHFTANRPILSGLFTVLRPPTDSNGMLMRWNVPRSSLCRWGRIERFMGMWMPWRPMSGGKQMLDAVAVWEDGSVWVDVRYSCAQFYEDDMSDDPLEDGEDRRRRRSNDKHKEEKEKERRGLFDRVRISGISSIDKRKETPRWMMWFHEMYARKLLDEAVRKLVKDAKADMGDGTRKRAMRVVEGEGMEGRIIEEEGSVMRGKENGFDGDGKA